MVREHVEHIQLAARVIDLGAEGVLRSQYRCHFGSILRGSYGMGRC